MIELHFVAADLPNPVLPFRLRGRWSTAVSRRGHTAPSSTRSGPGIVEDAGPPDAVSDPQGRPLDSAAPSASPSAFSLQPAEIWLPVVAALTRQNAGVARGYFVGG